MNDFHVEMKSLVDPGYIRALFNRHIDGRAILGDGGFGCEQRFQLFCGLASVLCTSYGRYIGREAVRFTYPKMTEEDDMAMRTETDSSHDDETMTENENQPERLYTLGEMLHETERVTDIIAAQNHALHHVRIIHTALAAKFEELEGLRASEIIAKVDPLYDIANVCSDHFGETTDDYDGLAIVVQRAPTLRMFANTLVRITLQNNYLRRENEYLLDSDSRPQTASTHTPENIFFSTPISSPTLAPNPRTNTISETGEDYDRSGVGGAGRIVTPPAILPTIVHPIHADRVPPVDNDERRGFLSRISDLEKTVERLRIKNRDKAHVGKRFRRMYETLKTRTEFEKASKSTKLDVATYPAKEIAGVYPQPRPVIHQKDAPTRDDRLVVERPAANLFNVRTKKMEIAIMTRMKSASA